MRDEMNILKCTPSPAKGSATLTTPTGGEVSFGGMEGKLKAGVEPF
jgi:hypothetical protein